MTSRLRRALPLAVSLCALALAGCATSPRSAEPVGPATRTIGTPSSGGSISISTVTAGPDVATVPYALAQVWSALPMVMDSLKVPIAKVDPTQHVFGNESFKVRQRLGKTSLSRYFDCGNTQIGPNADSYDVLMTVLVQLQPAGAAATTVSTTVQAMAKPVTFNQEYAQCSSKGELETRLLGFLKAQLQR